MTATAIDPASQSLSFLNRFDLPPAFIRRYRPQRVLPYERGARVYVFDSLGLSFFRRNATAAPVPANAIWSITNTAGQLLVQASECQSALGFLVTETPRPDDQLAPFPLLRRLSYRERVRVAQLPELLNDLTHAPFPVSEEVLQLLNERMARTGC